MQNIHTSGTQQWKVTKYTYSSTVLKYKFEVVFYLSISNFCSYFTTTQSEILNYIYFTLVAFRFQITNTKYNSANK